MIHPGAASGIVQQMAAMGPMKMASVGGGAVGGAYGMQSEEYDALGSVGTAAMGASAGAAALHVTRRATEGDLKLWQQGTRGMRGRGLATGIGVATGALLGNGEGVTGTMTDAALAGSAGFGLYTAHRSLKEWATDYENRKMAENQTKKTPNTAENDLKQAHVDAETAQDRDQRTQKADNEVKKSLDERQNSENMADKSEKRASVGSVMSEKAHDRAKNHFSEAQRAKIAKNVSKGVRVGGIGGLALLGLGTIADVGNEQHEKKQTARMVNEQERQLEKQRREEQQAQRELGYGYTDFGEIVGSIFDQRSNHHNMGARQHQPFQSY